MGPQNGLEPLSGAIPPILSEYRVTRLEHSIARRNADKRWATGDLPSTRHESPQFIEEILKEDHVVAGYLRFLTLGWHEADNSIPVWSQIEVPAEPGAREPDLGPNPRLFRRKRIADNLVGRDHDPAILGRKIQLRLGVRPGGPQAAATRDLPPDPFVVKGHYIHLAGARVI